MLTPEKRAAVLEKLAAGNTFGQEGGYSSQAAIQAASPVAFGLMQVPGAAAQALKGLTRPRPNIVLGADAIALGNSGAAKPARPRQ